MISASFDGVYPPMISVGFASHHALASLKSLVCTRGIHLWMFIRYAEPADDEMLAIAEPSGM
jgi:hypothetical protein